MAVEQEFEVFWNVDDLNREHPERRAQGWRVSSMSLGVTESYSRVLVLWERGPVGELSAKALACLAASPDPDVQAEATALITAAVES